jgi:hypothetical protein
MIMYRGESGNWLGGATEGMDSLSGEEIVAAFSKRDRKILKLPRNLSQIEWDEITYLSWRHPDGSKWFMVYSPLDELHGLVLEKVESAGSSAKQCSWCDTTNAGDKIAQFVVRHALNRNITIGISVCSSLNCDDYIRGRKSPSIAAFSSHPTLEKRMSALRSNLDNFFIRVLF